MGNPYSVKEQRARAIARARGNLSSAKPGKVGMVLKRLGDITPALADPPPTGQELLQEEIDEATFHVHHHCERAAPHLSDEVSDGD